MWKKKKKAELKTLSVQLSKVLSFAKNLFGLHPKLVQNTLAPTEVFLVSRSNSVWG
jgi:hypothetical protein